MQSLFTVPKVQVADDNGDPYAGAKLYTYEAGTTTPKATYTTPALTVAHANPVVADAGGRFASIWMTGTYYLELYTSAGVLIWSQDNYSSSPDYASLNTRNPLINAGFRIDQRNAGAAQTITSSSVYCLDRWAVIGTVTSATVQQLNGDATSPKCVRINRASGTSTGYASIFQVVETTDAMRFSGKTCTLSFRARKGSSYSASINAHSITGSGSDEGKAGVTAGTWTGYADATLTLSGTLTTTFSTFTATVTVPSGTKEIAIYLGTGAFSGTGDSNDYVEITDVQLEIGSTASPFEHRPIAFELQLAQRYFYRIGNTGALHQALLGIMLSSTVLRFGTTLPVPMRSTPTLNSSGVTWSASPSTTNVFGAYYGSYVASNHSSIAATIANSSPREASVVLTGTGGSFTGPSAGDMLILAIGGAAYIDFSAEL